ncbi:MAG: hypothetical protein SGPRY_014366, partial [Prymnesium sp.]
IGEKESDDILQWELNQLEKLKELATVYNWREKSALYKERVRLVQEHSPWRDRLLEWQKGKKVANFTSARSMLHGAARQVAQ